MRARDSLCPDGGFNWLLWTVLEELMLERPALIPLAEPDDDERLAARRWMVETADAVSEFASVIEALKLGCGTPSSGGRAESLATALARMCRDFARRWSVVALDDQAAVLVGRFNQDVLVLEGLTDLIRCGIGD